MDRRLPPHPPLSFTPTQAMIITLATLAAVPEPLYDLGQFLLGLLFIIGSAGRP